MQRMIAGSFQEKIIAQTALVKVLFVHLHGTNLMRRINSLHAIDAPANGVRYGLLVASGGFGQGTRRRRANHLVR
jgi:hypothetical protein